MYVDAVVPKPGESWSSTHASATREARLAAAAADPESQFSAARPFRVRAAGRGPRLGQTAPDAPPRTYLPGPAGVDPQRVAQVPRTFINCTQPPLATIDVIRTRVADPKFWDGTWLPGSRVVELVTGHDPMISEPEALTRLLQESSALVGPPRNRGLSDCPCQGWSNLRA